MFIVIPAVLSVTLLFVSVFCAIHFARCYSEMLSQSSTGLDLVRWPKDTFHDWLGSAWLILLVFGGVAGVTAILAVPFVVADPKSWEAILIGSAAAIFVWGAFPVVLCSLYHPRILILLPRRPGDVLRDFGMTMPLAIAAGAGFVLIQRQQSEGPYLVALFAPPAILIHARAWGRLVWLVLNERPHRPRSRKPFDFPEPEDATAIQAAEPTPTPQPNAVEGYALEATDFEPVPGHLAEHYENRREQERWQRLRAGEEIADPLGRTKSPRPWTALAARKIFGVLFQEGTAGVCVLMMVELGIVYGIMALIAAIFGTFSTGF